MIKSCLSILIPSSSLYIFFAFRGKQTFYVQGSEGVHQLFTCFCALLSVGMAGAGVAGAGILHISQSYMHKPMFAGSRVEVGIHLH